MNRAERIRHLLEQELTPEFLEVTDDSHQHAGHAGAQPGGQTHYTVTIRSAQFSGMSKVACHQAIYRLLDDEFKSGLHALAIHASAD
jgi:BolA family transcriptional regulator, general stress-responsive regulator